MRDAQQPHLDRGRRAALLGIVCVLTVMGFATTSGAQDDTTGVRAGVAPPPPPAPTSLEFSDGDLDRLYRDLYGVQVRIGEARTRSSAVDSLRAVREELLAEIRRLAREVERRGRDLQAPRESNEVEREFDRFVTDLEDAAVDQDWNRLAEVLGRHAQTWGEGLAALGAELEELQVDIDEDRVRVGTGSGSRITFTIPPEVKEELRRGIQEVGLELSRVLDDSATGRWGAELEGLFGELPEGVGQTIFGKRREPEKKIIGGSIFRFGEDVEVAEDELVRGDVFLVGADAYVEGEVDGNIYVLLGDLFVEGRGRVTSDAYSVGGRVLVDDDSEIHGRRFDVSGFAPGVLPGVWSGSSGLAWVVHGSRVAVLALLVVVAFQVLGTRMQRLLRRAEDRTGRDLAMGLLWLPVLIGVSVIASVGLIISVIGIPVVLVLVAALGVVCLVAYTVSAHVLGQSLLARLGAHPDPRHWQGALVGMIALEIPALMALALASAEGVGAGVVVLRGLDFVVRFAAFALGFGVIVATRGGMEDVPEDHPSSGGVDLALPPAHDPSVGR